MVSNRDWALMRANEFSVQPDEEFVMIEDFPGYFISNYGQVYSFKSDGLVEGGYDYDGRRLVSMIYHERHYQRYAHRLVAEAFLEKPDGIRPSDADVRPRDGDYGNAYAGNLEWVRRSRGFNRHAKPVRLIGAGLDFEFESISDCAKYLRISSATVINVLKNGGNYGDFEITLS